MASPLKYTSGAAFPDKVSWHCRNTKAPETPICRQLKRERTVQHTHKGGFATLNSNKNAVEQSCRIRFHEIANSKVLLNLLYIASLVHCLLYIASYILPLLYIASYILPLLFIASFTLPLLDIASYTLPFHIAFQLAIESCNTKTNAARL